MKKISIIVPNYNNNKFVEECLKSVAEQDYTEKEVIVVDDGSSDESVETIKRFIDNNKALDIKLICQSNLNGAIARNRGMSVASGDYILFLDSDDSLSDKSILSRLMSIYEKNDVSLVIGTFNEVDERGNFIKEERATDEIAFVDVGKNFKDLANASPMPSNKLYNLKKIRESDLSWGNVRIGQDLDFYLKYLSLCDKAALIEYPIYNYRINRNSVTRTYDFRIFDIVNVFEDVEKFYRSNRKMPLYRKYLPLQELRHFNAQMLKQRFYSDYKTRLLIINFFAINWKKVDLSMCDKDKNFKRESRKFYLQYRMRLFFATKLFRRMYELVEKRRMKMG